MKHILLLIFFLLMAELSYCQPANRKPEKPPPDKNLRLTSPTDLRYLVPPVKLEPSKKILFRPEKFFIERVEDSSGMKDAGFAILPKDYKKEPIVFSGRPEILFSNYIKSIAKRDSSLLPVIIRIKKLNISEKQLTKADMLASMDFALDVYFRKDGQLYFLDRFDDRLSAEIYVGFKRDYDEWIKKLLGEFIQVLDLLSDYAKTESILLPGETAVLTMLSQEEIRTTDTMVLTAQTPLKWTDFTASSITPDQMFLSSSLYMSRKKVIRDGKTTLVVRVEPVMVRNKSWSGFLARSNLTLLNNQRYDLLLIYWYALKLKKQLEPFVQPEQCSLFRTEVLFYSIAEELKEARNRYEIETGYGENLEKQKEWEDRIRNGIVNTYSSGN